MSAPNSLHRIKRKPPPSLARYPSPDPADPFASLSALRSRASSGLSGQDVPESDIVKRARSASYLYSTTPAQISLNTPTHSPKLGHHSPHSLIDSAQAFPLISSPLASRPDLLHGEQPFVGRRRNVHSPWRSYDLNDTISSATESDTPYVPPPLVHNTAFSQPTRTPSPKYRFPKLLLFKKSSFLGSGNRSSIIEFNQARKSSVSPPVVSTVTWIPSPVGSESINSRSTSKFTPSLSADLSDEIHQHHHNKKRSHSREDLKQDLPSQLKSSSISPKMFRKKRISFSMPFSSTTSPRKRSISASSYVHISMPTPVPFTQSASEDAYTSPRKAPVPPVSPSTIQGQTPSECSNKSCGLGYSCNHSISSEWSLPSLLQLNYAACLPITGEDGEHISFGSLFESQRTIVLFIRHFWCPLCQDYMSSVNSFIRPEMVCNTCESGDYRYRPNHEQTIRGADHNAGTRVRFVVISNGAYGMIAKYRQIFGLSFKVYTDPSLAVYHALGMGRDGDIKHHNQQTHRNSISSVGSSTRVPSEKNSDISKPGGYVRHGLMGGIAMVVVRAFKVGMPVWEKGGDIDQLGGEFVFGPGLTCTYAHRMQTPKGHAPIQDILKAAGILAPPTPTSTPTSNRTRTHTLSSAEVRRAKPELPIIPDWTTSLTGSGEKRRKRRESMHTTRDKESTPSDNAATSKAFRRRYSIGVMSLEDEDRWMEYRHDSIERLRAKKDIRRGIIRPESSRSYSGRPEYRQPLEMGSHFMSDHRRTRSDHASYHRRTLL